MIYIYYYLWIEKRKEKSLSFFEGKRVESLISKLPRKRDESQLDCLSTKSFLAKVVLRPLSQIFLKKYEIDLKKNVFYAMKKWNWYFNFLILVGNEWQWIIELQKVSLSVLIRVYPSETEVLGM